MTYLMMIFLNIVIDSSEKLIDENVIDNCISSLFRNRHLHGKDLIVSDLFIDVKTSTTPFLVQILNKMYSEGVYP
jgi:hypothetical protein